MRNGDRKNKIKTNINKYEKHTFLNEANKISLLALGVHQRDLFFSFF